METNTRLMLMMFLFATLVSSLFNFVEGRNGSAPRFKRPIIADQVAFVNHTVRLACKVRGNPRPTVLFFYEGQLITKSKRLHVKRNTLEIQNLQQSDSGRYSCKAENAHGLVWGNITLRVVDMEDDVLPTKDEVDVLKGAPEWARKRDTVHYLTRPATKSVTMNCDVRGYPKPTIAWYKDQVQIYPDGDKYKADGWRLTVSDLTMSDKGDYKCVVSNEYGSIDWTYKIDGLQLLAIAPVLEDIKNQTVMEGDNATFTCKIVMGDSQPILQWLRHLKVNGSFVSDKGEPYVKILKICLTRRTTGE